MGMTTELEKARSEILRGIDDLSGMTKSELYRMLARLSRVVRRWRKMKKLAAIRKELEEVLSMRVSTNPYLGVLRWLANEEIDNNLEKRLSVWAAACLQLRTMRKFN